MNPLHPMARRTGRGQSRHGAAAVELATVLPVLVLFTLGTLDAGQSINVAQIVSDASREGARQAIRRDVTDVEQVQTVVQQFMADSFPGKAGETLTSAVTVSVSDRHGDLPHGDLSAVASGSSVAVQVVLRYEAVRWISFLPGLHGTTLSTTTVMRRE